MLSPGPIDFYFDFSSPYGYLAGTRIDELAARHDREVTWRPYLMGALFKITGRQPLANHPLVREYAYRDLQRTARLFDVPFALPSKFPIVTANPCRAFYWLRDQDEKSAVRLAKALYTAYFVDDRDISSGGLVKIFSLTVPAQLSAVKSGIFDRNIRFWNQDG